MFQDFIAFLKLDRFLKLERCCVFLRCERARRSPVFGPFATCWTLLGVRYAAFVAIDLR